MKLQIFNFKFWLFIKFLLNGKGNFTGCSALQMNCFCEIPRSEMVNDTQRNKTSKLAFQLQNKLKICNALEISFFFRSQHLCLSFLLTRQWPSLVQHSREEIYKCSNEKLVMNTGDCITASLSSALSWAAWKCLMEKGIKLTIDERQRLKYQTQRTRANVASSSLKLATLFDETSLGKKIFAILLLLFMLWKICAEAKNSLPFWLN